MCLMAVAAVNANPITESRAHEIASRFMTSQSLSLRLAAGRPATAVTPVTHQAAYFVFNAAADKGFVIIAGDDRLPPVLGYSNTGSFDADDVPPAMQEWLDGYAAQVEAIAAGAAPEIRTANRAAIKPMLPVHWGQGMPYNVLLPHINGSSNAHAYVGCVAVAMAQVMAFWQYPPRPSTTIPSYVSSSGKTYQVTMPSLAPMDFDWDNMHDTYYTNDSTSDACLAVANLMLYSTTSLKSNFGLSSTGGYTRNIPQQLITYFGYKNSAHYIYRESFNTQSWEDTIYAELEAGRPVAYGGNKQSAGHAFVCDGYDGDGRFHINWGWAGKSNGYFLLNLLNPNDEGIGSAAGAYGYVKGQGAAIGLEPGNDGNEGTAAFTFEDLAINSTNTTRSAASSNFSVTVSGKFINYTNVTSQFRQGWGLFDLDGELLEVLFTRYTTSALGNSEYITVSSRPLNFGAGITSGTYRIKPIYSIYPSEDYRPCIGSDVNYIEVTIGGTYSCTIKGYGTAGSTTKYTVNSCNVTGTQNHGKPLTFTLNLKNEGTSTNDLIYMFVDGEFTAMGLANIAPGKSGDLIYRYTPSSAGNKTITFSLSESGTPILHSRTVTINTMPTAELEVSYRILNITDEDNRVITADRYSIIADVTNNGTSVYNEDFSVRLYRINNDETNVGTELLSQTQQLFLPPGQTKSLQFDFDRDLIDGWKYFCYLYYYSNGETVGKGTKWYYLNLTDEPFTPETRYNINVNTRPDFGGIVQLSGHIVNGKMAAGEMLTVIVKPNIGWKSRDVIATDTLGNPIASVKSDIDTCVFVMPEGDINLDVNFYRASGSLFKMVETRAEINEGSTYIIASRTHNKVLRQWSDDNTTFLADDVAEWLDKSQSIVRVTDETCFINMVEVADTTMSGNTRTAAYLTNGNGYLRTNNYNVLLQGNVVPESRAWMYIGTAGNCLIRFKDTSSGSSGYWVLRYDNENDQFKVMNWNVSGAETSRVWLYKYVDEYSVNAYFDPDQGSVSIMDSEDEFEVAQQYETVTFTVTPAQGYTLDTVLVNTISGAEIPFELDEKTGTYSFIMPDEEVGINVTFEHSGDYLLGDVDNDGIVNIVDVTVLIDYILSKQGDINLINADVTQDGKIDIVDLTTLIDMVLTKP